MAPYEFYPDGRTAADVAIALIAVLVMPLMSTLRGRHIATRKPASLLPAYWSTIARGMLSATAVIGMWWVLGRDFAALGLAWPPGERGLIGLALVGVLAIAAAGQIAMLSRLSQEKLEAMQERIESMKILPRSARETRVFMLVSLSAGIWEELLYRGFLTWFFAPWLGGIGAAAAATAIFGLGHAYQGPGGVLRTAALGAVFAAGYLLTGSLWWLIAAHALVDVFGGLVARRVATLRGMRAEAAEAQ